MRRFKEKKFKEKLILGLLLLWVSPVLVLAVIVCFVFGLIESIFRGKR